MILTSYNKMIKKYLFDPSWRFKGVGCPRGKCNLGAQGRDPMSWPYGLKQPMLRFQEKPRIKWSHVVPVPQTDSGGRGENPQALERTLAKELGKFPPYLRKMVGRLW
jgi:hypothetical protein